jgi:tetratricopeptide (TPR) repeat protein
VSARRKAFLAIASLVAAATTADADRLHLASGGSIETDHWWVEGETLLYETGDGTVGIPRALVERIERIEGRTSPRGSDAPAPLTSHASSGPTLSARMAEAQRAFQARSFEHAAALYLDVLRDEPTMSAARVGYALSQMALGADGSALPVVREGLVLDPDHAGLNEALGMLLDRDERVRDALRAYRRAFELAPSDRLRDKILRAERELAAAGNFDFAVSSHFQLSYDGEVDVDLANQVLELLERLHGTLTAAYRHTPLGAIVVQLLPREAFREVTQAPEWVGGVYDGKIRVPLGGLSRLGPATERLLAHELTHAIVQSKSRGAAPRWLHEGLAQLAERRTLAPTEIEALRTLFADTPEVRWSTIPFRYDLALGLTRSLVERQGFDSAVDLLDLLAQGHDLDAALERVYGEDYAALLVDWGRSL